MGAAYFLMGLRYSEEMIDQLYQGATMLEESVTYQRTLKRGEISAAQRILLRLGTNKFGPLPTNSEAAIRTIQDLARLERLIELVSNTSSWDELLATP